MSNDILNLPAVEKDADFMLMIAKGFHLSLIERDGVYIVKIGTYEISFTNPRAAAICYAGHYESALIRFVGGNEKRWYWDDKERACAEDTGAGTGKKSG